MRKTGIDIIGDSPWGTHFCQFYQTGRDLADILVSYFKAGLENNEFCMWITSADLSREEAEAALASAVPDFDRCRRAGQIEILPYTDWYLKDGRFDLQRVLAGWVEKMESALARGFDGLRLSGNTVWLEKEDWQDFAEYEHEVNRVLCRYRIIALCTYSLSRCDAFEILDVVRNHQFALIKNNGAWELIENSVHRQVRVNMHASEARYRGLVEVCPDAIFVIRAGRIEFANPAALRLLGADRPEQIVGKSPFDIFHPDCHALVRERIERALQGESQPLVDEIIVRLDGVVVDVESAGVAFTDAEGTAVQVILRDVTERKRAEVARQHILERFELLAETADNLLKTSDPQGAVDSLCRRVMAHLDCHAFFNYLVDERAGRLRLNASAGIPREEAKRIEWLDYGAAVCGCVARDGQRIVAERIPSTPDPRTELVKAYGIRAYACHPLQGPGGKTIGTLSFGTRNRETFSDEDLSLMKAVADQVATAMIRIRNEQALRESEARYRSLFNGMTEGFALHEIVCDGKGVPRDYRFLEINPAFEWLTGLRRGDVVGRLLSEVLPGESAVWVKIYGDVALTGRSVHFENRSAVLGRDFEVFAYRTAPGQFAVLFVDVTERKRAQERIAWLASFPQVNPYPVIEADLEGGVEFLNPAAEKLFPDLRERRADHPWLEGWPETARELSRTGTAGTVREVFVQGRWYQQMMYFVEQTRRIRIYGMDITERKQNEQLLEQQAKRLREQADLVELAHAFAWDMNERIVRWNRGAETLYGWTKDEAVGQLVHVLLKTEFPQPLDEIKAALIRDGSWESELLHVCKDGRRVVVASHWVINRDEQGRPAAILEVNNDITERKRAEQTLLEARDRLDAHVQERTAQLTATIQTLKDEVARRTLAEQQARETSRYARALIEASLDPLVTISRDGKITDVNRATEEATGVARQELVGTDFSAYFTEPDQANAGYRKVLADGFVRNYPLTIRHRSGQTIDVLYNATI
ncbi:MAG: PAS domain S-box protein, partial [bacterium]|nr:PAS domain S-box protein [bacterium]